MYHVADLLPLFYQYRYCYKRVVLQHFTWCLLWVLKAESTLKFHKPQMADYQYRTSLVMERPPSNFEHPVQLTKQMRQLQWQTAHLSAAHTRRYMPDCHLPRREQEDRAVFLLIFGDRLQIIDGRGHCMLHCLQIKGVRLSEYVVSRFSRLLLRKYHD